MEQIQDYLSFIEHSGIPST